MKVLVIDVGGSHIKMLVSGQRTPRKVDSGPDMTPQLMVKRVREATQDWQYDRISIGYPGPTINHRLVQEPHNLGRGWVGFDFRKAFKKPVRLINDAAMQALGSYRGGKMLFLGLGTGLGSAMIVDGLLLPLELAHLPYQRGKTYEDYLGTAGLHRAGEKKWRELVLDVAFRLKDALLMDYIVLGGGNSRLMKKLPKSVSLGLNTNAFKGGFRLWEQ